MSYDPSLCPICIESYDSRNYLPCIGRCGHSVCNNCVRQINHQCPYCMEETFASITTNHLAMDLLTLIDKAKDEQRAQQKNIEVIKHYKFDNAVGSSTRKPSHETNYVGNSVKPGSISFPLPSIPSDRRTIVISNVPKHWTLNQIRNEFSDYGFIEECVFLNAQNVNKGSAAISYRESSSATKAISSMNGALLQDCQIFVSLQKEQQIVRPEESKDSMNSQAIKNFATRQIRKKSLGIRITGVGNVTEEKIRSFFDRCGTITEVYMPKDSSNKPKGVIFIYFTTKDAVLAAQKYDVASIPGVSGKMTITKLE